MDLTTAFLTPSRECGSSAYSDCSRTPRSVRSQPNCMEGRSNQSAASVHTLGTYKNISFLPTSTNFSIITFISTRTQRNPPPPQDGLCSENSASESIHHQPLRLLYSGTSISCRGYGRDWTFPTRIQQASSNRRGRRPQDGYRSSLVSYWRNTKYTEARLRFIGKFGRFSHVYS